MVRSLLVTKPGRRPRGAAQGVRSLITGTGALVFLIATKTPHGNCPLLVEVRHSQVLGGTHTGESKPPGVAMGSLHAARCRWEQRLLADCQAHC